jgi:succinate dehydrogenase/fumarate reductase flavoprotein subunit
MFLRPSDDEDSDSAGVLPQTEIDTTSMNPATQLETDILVIGGGTAGCVAAIKAQEAMPDGIVLLLEKANVKRSGAIALGMDGVNNAIVPGHATPEQYVKEITMANDGIVNQKALLAYAQQSFSMIQELESWGVKFQKTATGDYDVKKVHHKGSYVLPMPEGYDIKKILSRTIRRAGVKTENRVMATRVLVDEDRAAGIVGFNVRTGEFVTIRAKAVILCCGSAGRLGLPASGYLMGTYENPSNAGDGYSMAYHAGAELTNIECFQINPLLKDYNGPSCAYVSGPFGGYTVNAKGNRFMLSDYWSGQMMLEFYKELTGPNGPVFLKMDHLAPETVSEIERILHTTERPSRGRFHAGRGTQYGERLVEMAVSEIGLCSGHSASGVWVNEQAETTIAGLYAAGDMASVPHNYMLGAFTYGKIAAHSACDYVRAKALAQLNDGAVVTEQKRVLAPLENPNGIQPHLLEYKIRRHVNDYLQPPKNAHRLQLGLEYFVRAKAEIEQLGATEPHDLMRAVECAFIRDCAEMAARASLHRTESRWGLYHYRNDFPDMDNENWFVHVNIKRSADDQMQLLKRPVEPYVVPLDDAELMGYHELRINHEPAGIS